jgi:hypothetical protein
MASWILSTPADFLGQSSGTHLKFEFKPSYIAPDGPKIVTDFVFVALVLIYSFLSLRCHSINQHTNSTRQVTGETVSIGSQPKHQLNLILRDE